MAAAVNIDEKEIQICIKSALISNPNVVKASTLQREIEDQIGKRVPFRQLGFPSFVDYLRSIPTVVQVEQGDSYNPNVYPIASQNSSHIDQLVSRQRVSAPKRRGVSRRGAYNSRPPIRRRPPARVVSRPPPPVTRPRPNQFSYPIQSQVFRSQAIFSSLYPSSLDKGIDVRDLESYMTGNYDKRDLMRNGLHSADNLLSHAEGMVERGDTKVYPKLAGASNNTDRRCQINGIPAGLEDDFEDYDEEYEIYDEEVEKDSEEELSKEAIQLWSRALGEEGNGATPRSQEGGEILEQNFVKTDSKTSEELKQEQVILESKSNISDKFKNIPTSTRPLEDNFAPDPRQEIFDEHEELPYDDSNISSAMINNFRIILNNHPEGIWASQLQQLYFEQFHVTLDLLDLGHTSAISLASSLPSVFTFKREGSHDWKLYDAQYVSQESLDAPQNGCEMLLSENGRYIPQTIIDNIKKLLEVNPNGFRSTDLLDKYMEAFRKPLDLLVLGFNTLEEFLMILKDDVTLKKVVNYYLLLPKHKVLPFDALEPTKPDERLNIPAEALCVPIPENVLGLGEEIPLQELPPVEMDPSPDKPLLELEVRVAEVISPVFFYMTLDSMYEELENMMDDLHKYYMWEEANFLIPLPVLSMNLYCAAKYSGFWHRAKITRIKNHGDVEIEYIDYGTPSTVKSSELRYLSKEFATLPAQAICAKLIGIKPLNGATKFPSDVCEAFLGLVQSKRLVAHVYQVAARVRKGQERMQLELVLYDVENPKAEMVLNDYLIENGLASPISQMQDSSVEIEQPVTVHLLDNDFIYHEANGSSMPLPSSGVTSLSESALPSPLENGSTSLPTSSIVTLLKSLLSDFSSNESSPHPSPRIPTLSLHPNKNKQPEKKPRRPPPGFKELPIQPNFEFSPPPPSASPTHSGNNHTQPSMSAEKQKPLFINNYIMMTPMGMYTKMMLQDQCLSQNVYRPNPSNMPLAGPPLFQPQQNMLQQHALTYGSFPPQQNLFNPRPNIYQQQNFGTVPPAHNHCYMNGTVLPVNFQVPLLMNHPVPNYPFSLPNQTYNFNQAPPSSNMSARVQGHGGDPASGPQCVKIVHPPPSPGHAMPSPKPSPTIPTPASSPAIPTPASSPGPVYTPVTVPEWPLQNFKSYTHSSTEMNSVPCSHHSVPAPSIKSESPEVNQIPRPGTPLTPASAEVANICKQSRPTSSASHNSQSVGSPSFNTQVNGSPQESSTINSQINASPVDNAMSDSQSKVSERDYSTDLSMGRNNDYQPETEVNEISLPADLDVKGIPLPPSPSPDKLYSAISSPVESLVRTSPIKEESSDDYASATETADEAKQQLSNMTLTEQCSMPTLKSPCETNEDIPDSWENLELDDTPAKAANFSVDFSQPLDLIINNIACESTNNPVGKSVESEVKSETSLPLKIQVPMNWKDTFNPDTISSSERNDNNNKVKGKSSSPAKFGVKKIPVQKLEIQGKFFHLLNINNRPAVIILEFFKQFVPNNSPAVSEKVLELKHSKEFFYISRTEYPAILAELDKLTEFCGGVPKKTVIRINKLRLIHLTETPQCLKNLNVPYKPLLDDLKRLADEFEMC